MIESSVLGLKYARLIRDEIDPIEIDQLVKKYQYLYIVTYADFRFPKFDVSHRQTPTIELSQDLDEIFKNFNQTTRNEIRKTERLDGFRFLAADDDFDGSYDLYQRVKRKDGVLPEYKEDFRQCVFFNAYLNDRMIVSIACYDSGQVLRFKTITSLRKDQDIDSKIVGYATRRLVWEICQYGKGEKHNKIDFGIINLTDPSKAGIAQFKRSFGADMVDTYICRYETTAFKFVRGMFRFFRSFDIH